jgi:hypothetical protein
MGSAGAVFGRKGGGFTATPLDLSFEFSEF